MAIPPPFGFLEGLLQQAPGIPAPPAWAVEEAQRRCVLLINHVLMQEPQAMQRLVRQQGRVVLAQWRIFTFVLRITPAGLFDLAEPGAVPDLSLTVLQESPLRLAQGLVQGDKPAVRIEGDVQLAADINWLADNLRWDVEEDLARIVGDVPAHLLAQTVTTVYAALRRFVAGRFGAAA